MSNNLSRFSPVSDIDVLVVGAGGAGLSAALEAASLGARVGIFTRNMYVSADNRWSSGGGCTWKTHAFNAAVREDDDIEAHIADTLNGGYNIGDPALVKLLCAGSVEIVDWLSGLGIDLCNGEGSFDVRPFGGNGAARGVFKEDRLGWYIQQALTREVSFSELISVHTGYRLLDFLLDAGEIVGALLVDEGSGEKLKVFARSVVVADGAGASMYEPSAVSSDKTCDGIAAALRAGAAVSDMEFVQFHPTGLVPENRVFVGTLVEEALRFDGARLLGADGSRFMFNYDERGEQATRDVVSRGIYTEIRKGNGIDGNHVALDLSECPVNIEKVYPAMAERFRLAGLNLSAARYLPVCPTAHFMMGGIEIDTLCRTSINGLWAAGETATGVHGANRLGGNGLSEALVFGRVAGRGAAEVANRKRLAKGGEVPIAEYHKASKSLIGAHELLVQLRREMYANCGPLREKQGIERTLDTLSSLEERASDWIIPCGDAAPAYIQLTTTVRSLLIASRAIAGGALLREESRGSHWRIDFPGKTASPGRIRWHFNQGELLPEFVAER
ncbi:FAD-binding protein [Corynebacterium pseudodiphtheriticum]|uniref:FAD-binding protein n=1 Tax=Corynebacterium pseudodiphtheriticum TaxID=37637 RepID=UPI002543162B|nr:FAD-binding protein [Corynebacterium pseudodiphtheriticum]MDK4327715.1 FAD-binding protein [Corynebacterium pseudodiphtheriticum]